MDKVTTTDEAHELYLEVVRAGYALKRIKSNPDTRLGDLWQAQARHESAQAAFRQHVELQREHEAVAA